MPDVIISNLPGQATTPLTGTERIPMDQRVGGTIAATALTPGLGYAIVSVGSTNWTTCGVPAGVTAAVGLVFTCSAVGTGTGTAQQVETVDAAASDVAALAASTNLGYAPSTRLLTSSTGTDVTLPLAAPTTAGLLPPTNDPLALTDLTVTGTLTAAHIHGAMAGPLYIHVRNDSGTTLAAGATVHVTGNQGDTDRMLVVLARADDPATMPANGILLAALAPNGDGHAVVVGEATGMNTAGLTPGAQVFVALTGGLTLTRPATNPQAIATVGRVHASTGSLLVNASPVLSGVAFSGAYGDLSGRPAEISQADAEAGAGTAFSLWSAQRWRQAAAEWWLTVTSTVGRQVVGAADQAAARSAISAEQAGAASAAVTAHASSVTPVHSASQISGLLSDSAPQNHAAIAAAGTATSASRADHVHQFQPSDVVIPLSAPAGNVATGEAENFAWPRATILTAIPVWSVKTAPAGSAMQFDIRVGGTSIFSTLPTIAIGGTTSSATTPAVFSAAFVSGGQTIAAGSLVTFHVTQIGSSTAGAGLKVALPTRRAS